MSSQHDMQAVTTKIARLETRLEVERQEFASKLEFERQQFASRVGELERQVTTLKVESRLSTAKPEDAQITASSDSFDPALRAQLTRLQETIAAHETITAEQDKIIAEQDKIIAGQDKMLSHFCEEIDFCKGAFDMCNGAFSGILETAARLKERQSQPESMPMVTDTDKSGRSSLSASPDPTTRLLPEEVAPRPRLLSSSEPRRANFAAITASEPQEFIPSKPTPVRFPQEPTSTVPPASSYAQALKTPREKVSNRKATIPFNQWPLFSRTPTSHADFVAKRVGTQQIHPPPEEPRVHGKPNKASRRRADRGDVKGYGGSMNRSEPRQVNESGRLEKHAKSKNTKAAKKQTESESTKGAERQAKPESTKGAETKHQPSSKVAIPAVPTGHDTLVDQGRKISGSLEAPANPSKPKPKQVKGRRPMKSLTAEEIEAYNDFGEPLPSETDSDDDVAGNQKQSVAPPVQATSSSRSQVHQRGAPSVQVTTPLSKDPVLENAAATGSKSARSSQSQPAMTVATTGEERHNRRGRADKPAGKPKITGSNSSRVVVEPKPSGQNRGTPKLEKTGSPVAPPKTPAPPTTQEEGPKPSMTPQSSKRKDLPQFGPTMKSSSSSTAKDPQGDKPQKSEAEISSQIPSIIKSSQTTSHDPTTVGFRFDYKGKEPERKRVVLKGYSPWTEEELDATSDGGIDIEPLPMAPENDTEDLSRAGLSGGVSLKPSPGLIWADEEPEAGPVQPLPQRSTGALWRGFQKEEAAQEKRKASAMKNGGGSFSSTARHEDLLAKVTWRRTEVNDDGQRKIVEVTKHSSIVQSGEADPGSSSEPGKEGSNSKVAGKQPGKKKSI